ncbi:thioredoxin family protein [Aquimarina sp. AU474]|uniref:DUF1223 domain-containing protein n=1 Tax=Aquimarina sp. AU474 TaxID=2108529 RepID=UPI000D693022|nr:DUF1223 domain-containing protein [Aquimarina sp. AU474]
MKKKLLIVLTLIASISLNAQNNSESIVVLELFTSQGCSSCPPADRLLDNIRKSYEDKNVYVLSYHVDYWNRLGWKDPFSTASYSDYQREYAVKFNSRSIYTPQLVVNGSEHFTGSNRYKADDALQKYSKSKANNAIVLHDVKIEGEAVQLNYQVEGNDFDTITLALVVSERTTDVSRGENRNRVLKNSNIVANRRVEKENAGKVTIKIPEWISKNDKLSVIAYTQDSGLRTTGATIAKI